MSNSRVKYSNFAYLMLIANLLILNLHSQFVSSERYKIVYTHFYLKYTRLTLMHHIEYI